MKAKKILFNGIILNIDDSLKTELQNSFDESVPGCIIVNNVNISDIQVSVNITRRCKRFYQVDEEHINLDDAVIFSGVLNKDSQFKLPLGPLPYADLLNYSLSPEDIMISYNEIMQRNNKLLDLRVNSTENEVTYVLTFKA